MGPEGEKATADELRATWGPLQTQAGTFEISGNTLTTRASVAKSGLNTASGAFTENTFTLKGDTLVMVSTRTTVPNRSGKLADRTFHVIDKR